MFFVYFIRKPAEEKPLNMATPGGLSGHFSHFCFLLFFPLWWFACSKKKIKGGCFIFPSGFFSTMPVILYFLASGFCFSHSLLLSLYFFFWSLVMNLYNVYWVIVEIFWIFPDCSRLCTIYTMHVSIAALLSSSRDKQLRHQIFARTLMWFLFVSSGDWSNFNHVSIGNELMSSSMCAASEYILLTGIAGLNKQSSSVRQKEISLPVLTSFSHIKLCVLIFKSLFCKV